MEENHKNTLARLATCAPFQRHYDAGVAAYLKQAPFMDYLVHSVEQARESVSSDHPAYAVLLAATESLQALYPKCFPGPGESGQIATIKPSFYKARNGILGSLEEKL